MDVVHQSCLQMDSHTLWMIKVLLLLPFFRLSSWPLSGGGCLQPDSPLSRQQDCEPLLLPEGIHSHSSPWTWSKWGSCPHWMSFFLFAFLLLFFYIYIFMHNFRFNAGSSWKQREVTAMEPAKETLWVLQLLLTVPACTVSHSLNSTSVSWMEYHFDLLNWIHCRKQTENFVLKDNPLVYVFVFFFYELKLSQKSVWENIPLVLLTWSRLYNI